MMSSIDVNNSESVATEIKFSVLCRLCDKIESKKTKKEKKELIEKFINGWRSEAQVRRLNHNFYPALRLLCPSKDIKIFSHTSDETTDESNEQNVGRSAYGLKEDKLREKYIKVLDLHKDSDDAKSLKNFNKSNTNETKDFANVLFDIMSKRSRNTIPRISIKEMNEQLDRIADSYQQNRVKDAEQVFKELILNQLTALENKWLVRIILKNLHLGIGDTSILSSYHSDAVEYYNSIHNLLKVCVDLSDPKIPLSFISVQLFSPFGPMLSERVKLKSINRKIIGHKFYIEVKYDGERFQIHKQSNRFKYFSRNCNDFSESFNHTLSPFISNAFDDSVVDCILDGEMMAFEPKSDRLVLKSETIDVKHFKKDDERHPLYVVFDILYLNGEVLTGKPLTERIEILERVIKPIKSRLHLAERSLCETREEIIDSMNAAIDRREEGIIVKLSESVYKLNKREGGWLKLKPDYIDGLMDELDLLIVGADYGERGGKSHFLLGIKDSDDSNPQNFTAICRVGTGYSNQELRELQTKLEIHWKEIKDKKKYPNFLSLGRVKPQFLIEPKNSVVVQVKAAEIIESNGEYGTIRTLRFPRVMRIRDDKEWHQCMSYTEFEQMVAKGSLANPLDYDSNEEPEAKKRKQLERPTISSRHRVADVSDIRVKCHIFEDKEFCVVPTKDPSLKQSLEKLIVEYGGRLTAAPLPLKTFCIIAQNCDTIAVKRHINCGKYDVIKHEWIQRCINANQLLSWTPNDIWSQTKETENKMSQQFDRFGDSYTEDIYEEELKELFEKMTDLSGIRLLSNREIADIEFEYWPNERDSTFLRTIEVFVDNHESNDKFLVKLIESQLRFFGANIVRNLTENTSHVVVLNHQRSDYFKQINRRNVKKFHIVSQDWVQKCIEMKDIVDFVDL